jgi:hypothetical protein
MTNAVSEAISKYCVNYTEYINVLCGNMQNVIMSHSWCVRLTEGFKLLRSMWRNRLDYWLTYVGMLVF